MTIGIYALIWDNCNLTYVGQSINIENRFDQHMYEMLSGNHCNKRIIETYQKYGPPYFVVLEECTEDKLNQLEVVWFNEFGATLNIVDPGVRSLRGPEHGGAKYTRLQIIQVFRKLSGSLWISTQDIINSTGVKKDVIISILSEKSHAWLKDRYPFRYTMMVKRRRERNILAQLQDKLIHKVVLISPEGIEYNVTNITGFAKEHNLDQAHLSKVVNKKRKTHKGWKLKL